MAKHDWSQLELSDLTSFKVFKILVAVQMLDLEHMIMIFLITTLKSEMYLEPSQTSIFFAKKAPSQIFDEVLHTFGK